jgi:hypothetical protein
MGRKQLLLKQELTVSQILRTYGKQFTQITEQYSDGHNGRCATGVIMSYFGWNGIDDSRAAGKLLAATNALREAGVSQCSIIELNDSGFTFDEIADYIDRHY